MASITEPTSVELSIDVDVPVERAYQVFTQRFDAIKPREHNLLEADIAETVLEPWVGGRAYDIGVDGSECTWGVVLAVDEPTRLVFSWQVSPVWQHEPDPARASEVEVTFTALEPGRTRVDLSHRHLDRHGDGWQGERDAVAADQGWPLYLGRFAGVVPQR